MEFYLKIPINGIILSYIEICTYKCLNFFLLLRLKIKFSIQVNYLHYKLINLIISSKILKQMKRNIVIIYFQFT